MAQQEGNPSSEREAEPSLERCPNCGRPLRFPADQAEAYCPACGIFVEMLRPLGPASAEPKAVEDDQARLQTARLYLELDSILAGDMEEEPAEPLPSAQAGGIASEVETEVAEEGIEALPGSAEVSAPAELAATTEPSAVEVIAPEAAAEPSVASSAESAAVAVARPRRWHRVLFYGGSLLVAFGGSGLALGSVFHDVFRVPFFGFAYDAFGNLNVSALVFGGAFLLAGFAAMAVGARAGARPRRAVGG